MLGEQMKIEKEYSVAINWHFAIANVKQMFRKYFFQLFCISTSMFIINFIILTRSDNIEDFKNALSTPASIDSGVWNHWNYLEKITSLQIDRPTKDIALPNWF